MNFAVLLAKDDSEAPQGIPPNWPTRVQSIGDATRLPDRYPDPWLLMSEKEVATLKAANEAAKEAWNSSKETEAAAPKRDRDALIRQAKADLTTIVDTTGALTAAQLSNAARATARILRALIEDLGY